MEKYLVQGRKSDVQIIFGYNQSGMLVGYEYNGSLTQEQYQWLIARFPFTIELLKRLESIKELKIFKIETDTSFKSFWSSYNYKVGNKPRAEKLWEKLPEMDKIIAISKIDYYNNYLKLHPNIERAYPETWLNQRRWENQY